MTYSATLNYLYKQLPMFHRLGAIAYKADLNNTNNICKFLNYPEKKFKSVHIAGTNGKGSSSHMLAAILQTCGYKVGLYTSPHLLDFRERIRVDGKMIPKNYIVNFVEKHKINFEKIKPSFFEWTVGLAFDFFRNEKVDIAIIETGMGGRLDSTNVIKPLVSLITNIGMDHTNILGDTLKKIAIEKAGIIKKSIPIVISERQDKIVNVFIQKAKKENAKLFFAQDEFISFFHLVKEKTADICVTRKSNGEFEVYVLDLLGKYQLKNLPGVLQVLEILKNKKFKISTSQVKKALLNVVKHTGLRGRFEILQKTPKVICDIGHNAEGIVEVLEMISKIEYNKLHIIFGVVNDKDVSNMLKLLPQKNTQYYFTKANIPRALNEKHLKKMGNQFGLKGKKYSTVKEALTHAKKLANKNDLIFIGGSTFVVGEALEFY